MLLLVGVLCLQLKENEKQAVNKLKIKIRLLKIKSLFVLQNFSTAQKSGNISYIPKAFLVRHSSEYEASDSDRKVNQNVYSQMRIHMVK